jgi:heme exporter protein A
MKNNSLVVRDLKIPLFHVKHFCNSAAKPADSLSEPMVNFTLNAGELLLVKGGSGSGKSFLLKLIAGILTPTSGEIHFNDRPIQGQHPAPSIYIGNPSQLRCYRSLRHNVRRWAQKSGHPELYDAAMSYFEMEPLASVRLGHLSDGYRQRALLTRLITMPGPVWLLDDPFMHLDEAGAALLNVLIQTRLEQHGIVLLATHQNFTGARVKTLNLSEPAHQDSAMRENQPVA